MCHVFFLLFFWHLLLFFNIFIFLCLDISSCVYVILSRLHVSVSLFLVPVFIFPPRPFWYYHCIWNVLCFAFCMMVTYVRPRNLRNDKQCVMCMTSLANCVGNDTWRVCVGATCQEIFQRFTFCHLFMCMAICSEFRKIKKKHHCAFCSHTERNLSKVHILQFTYVYGNMFGISKN